MLRTAVLTARAYDTPSCPEPTFEDFVPLISRDEFQYIIDHVFLPPKLSKGFGKSKPMNDDILLTVITELSREYVNRYVPEATPSAKKFQAAVHMLEEMHRLHDAYEGHVSKGVLRDVLLGMGDGDTIALYIKAQNACVTITQAGQETIIETFEVSPSAQEAVNHPRLRMSFPGPAVAIPTTTFEDSGFKNVMSSFLADMYTDYPTDLPVPTRTIGGMEFKERRETVMPIYITEFLTGILRGIGRPHEPSRFCKRVADEVLVNEEFNITGSPARRSPLWLVMRVALQRILLVSTNPGVTRHLDYKQLMLYITTRLLGIATDRAGKDNLVPSETLHQMKAKVSRRAAKLSSTGLLPDLLAGVNGVVKETARIVEERWSRVQESYKTQACWPPEPAIDIQNDTNLTMVNSSGYITDVLKNYQNPPGMASNSAPTGTLIENRHLDIESHTASDADIATYLLTFLNTCGDKASKRMALMDIEAWVSRDLTNFVERYISLKEGCRYIYNFSKCYVNLCTSLYQNNPEDISLMILTSMELWVAMDRIATNTCPILMDHDVPMETAILSHLLLPTQLLMTRCHRLEEYIRHRKGLAKFGTTVTIDEVNVTEHIFGVRYFDTSPHLQQLRARIIAEATIQREAKREEYLKARDQYNQLRREIANLNCECEFTGPIGKRVKVKKCHKCVLTTQADSMSITIFEWPLPTQENACKAAVFELDVPDDFAAWRDMTYWLMTHVLYVKGTKDIPNQHRIPQGSMDDYPVLRNYYQKKKEQEITWASESITPSYRLRKLIQYALSESDVLCSTALRFRSRSISSPSWAHDLMNKAQSEYTTEIRKRCTYKLPDAYRALQYAINSTEHSPNHCIANQHDCPWQEMSLNEYEAFTTLRSGFRLQWWNIFREIQAGTLNLNQVEVQLLFVQTIWEAGPTRSGSNSELETIARESHLDTLDEEFGTRFIRVLKDVLASVVGNWLKQVLLSTIIMLSSRILSLTPFPNVRVMAADLLRECRAVALKWLRKIEGKIHSSESNLATLHGWQVQALEIAAVCRSTFNVDSRYTNLVLHGDCDVADLLESAINIQRYTLPDLHSLPPQLRFLLERDLRVARNLAEILENSITRYTQGIDDGLRRIWPQYEKGNNGWKQQGVPKGWMWAVTNDGRKVHYNLLSGELLVEFRRFGQLPKEYINHETYSRIFGNRVLVVVSKSNGSEFELTSPVHKEDLSLKVNLTMRKGELIIRTKSNSTEYELIPHTKLQKDFSITFITPFAHFLNLNTRKIEFRPLETNLWSESKHNWVISIGNVTNGGPWRSQGTRLLPGESGEEKLQLVDIHSRTSSGIQKLFEPLECKDYIELLVSKNNLTVSLSRYKLIFECQVGGVMELSSRSFPGMVVDIEMMKEKNLGTLYGLWNILILRDITNKAAHKVQRTLLIPHGDISAQFNHQLQHTAVVINPHVKGSKIDYHVYSVDANLGSLVTNGSLRSHFYKVYLHALTAHCASDPLTGITGTEQALDDLRSAISWSFQKLGGDEITLLNLIAQLTPKHTYFEQDKNINLAESSTFKIEQVAWSNNLPCYAQHGMFHSIVQDIFAYWQRICIFHSNKQFEVPDNGNDKNLLQRAAVRQGAYLSYAYGGDLWSQAHDAKYVSRNATNTDHEQRVCQTAALVKNWSTQLDTTMDLVKVLHDWRSVELNGKEQDWGDLDDQIRYWHINTLSKDWFALYNLCRKTSREQHAYQLLFLLCSLAYRGEAQVPLQIVYTLLGFATMPTFKSLDPPQNRTTGVYEFEKGTQPLQQTLESIFNSHRVPFEASRESRLPRLSSEGEVQHKERIQAEYDTNLKQDVAAAVSYFSGQWVCKTVIMPLNPPWRLIKANQDLTAALNQRFTQWYNNKEYLDHISHVQTVLNVYRKQPENLPDAYCFEPCYTLERSPKPTFGMRSLLERVDPSALDSGIVEPHLKMPKALNRFQQTTSKASDSLHHLLTSFNPGDKIGSFGNRYMQDLSKSLGALQIHNRVSATLNYKPPPDEQLQNNQKQWVGLVDALLDSIQVALSPLEGTTDHLLWLAGLWPRITVRNLLRQLTEPVQNSNDDGDPPPNLDQRQTPLPHSTWSVQDTDDWVEPSELYQRWNLLIVTLAELITGLQRVTRVCYHARMGNVMEFSKEVSNTGAVDWGVDMHSERLLFEIESNLLIRPVQAQIAKEMLTPRTGKNSVMQLNMGEGKSSVIVPLVAAALADGTRLVRVVVLKPLCNQMFHLLAQKLGGLLNRRIYYLPFSRDVNSDEPTIAAILKLYKECMANGGILLTQPDHLLSFKLRGIESLSHNNTAITSQLLQSQKWLDTNSRDILDESDEILHVKYQLIYTLGDQQPPDLHTERWSMIQEIFDLILQQVYDLKGQNPGKVEVLDHENAPGSFPTTRLLHSSVGDKLIAKLADAVINQGALNALPTRCYKSEQRRKAFTFVTEQHVSELDAQQLCQYYGQQAEIPPALLLLRGLFVHGILRFALQEKRYRVDYGLDLGRTMLAVPYRAKDSPAPRAEFGHPDVAIILTCLAYYYSGLDRNQLQQCFKALHKLANSAQIYHNWISACKTQIPHEMHNVDGVNTQDQEQWEQHTYPKLRFNKAVVDFYLATIVFPRACKEFPHKLTTTGWDLAEEKGHPITGFSGTNDNRYLLPLPIDQIDLEGQLHTNAKVLQYLLQPENSQYKLATSGENERVNVPGLLDMLMRLEPPVQVLLDVGAQVLEMGNFEVAKLWLERSLRTRWEAVVYFNADDELTVLSRDGTIEPLFLSPYAKNLNHCLVFLDEAHTRGTDLKLPTESRAVVTLGPRLTKDRLVQACMRMRKLGHGQSVTFFAPPEVHARILQLSQPNVDPAPATCSTTEIIQWVMHESCVQTQRSIPLWASQGLTQQTHQCAWTEHTRGMLPGRELRSAWLQKEARTLKQLYGIDKRETSLASLVALALGNPKLNDRKQQLEAIRNRCIELGIIDTQDSQASIHEEHEREVAQEVQVELPPRAKPIEHHISDDVSRFLAKGRFDTQPSSHIIPVMKTLSSISFYQLVEQYPWCSDLYATADFMKTIKLNSIAGSHTDDFLRRVTWLVSSNFQSTLLIISPYEAQHFLPDIRRSEVVHLHIYSAKVQSDKSPFDNLIYAIPALPQGWTFRGKEHVVTQLNLFAGQLFFSSYESYQRTCKFLGIYMNANDEAPAETESDGWLPGSWALGNCDEYVREQMSRGHMKAFVKSPVKFIRMLAELRRKGVGISGTHVGKLVNVRVLREEDFSA